jgi:exodeoxyribonuclease VII large subunit
MTQPTTATVISVAALNRRARELLQQHFPLLWIAGEISNLTRAASGHVYFTLKDETAQVRCAMFRSRAQLIPWQLENGQQVEVQALVSLYEARGEFQLTIEGIRRAGLGRLYEAYARLRARLEAEGLFAAAQKRPLPIYPRKIGIVTSPQAAALQDILTALQRRAAHLPTLLYPAPVQGDGAAEKIAAAITLAGQRAAADGIDVLIVARGGGSIEDLWAFNEECVARAIAACPLPVVCGIGHETDDSIADFVADRRAATPTAAAELVSAGWFEVTATLAQLGTRLFLAGQNGLQARMQQLDLLAHRLQPPERRIELARQQLAHQTTRLDAGLARQLRQHAATLTHCQLRLAQARPAIQPLASRLAHAAQRMHQQMHHQRATLDTRLAGLEGRLAGLDPQATLARGYSIVRDTHGALIRDSRQLNPGDRLELQFAHGSAQTRVEHCDTPEAN